MTTYRLTDEEYAEALRAAFNASNQARFDEDMPDDAAEIGVAAGRAKAEEIARRRLSATPPPAAEPRILPRDPDDPNLRTIAF